MNILFLCNSNSVLSQIAEGIAKSKYSGKNLFESAGANPLKLNPCAIEVMKEIGIDISRNYSKGYDRLPIKFIVNIDYIITICSDGSCPEMASRTAQKLTWNISDPSTSNDSTNIELFRAARDQINSLLEKFIQDLIIIE